MLIDLMAAMSHKDWLSRRQRQNRESSGLIQLESTGVSRPIRNGIRKSCTTGR